MKNVIDSKSLSALFADKQNNGGMFTVRSLATNKDFTFKVATKKWNGRSYTHVSVETGYLNFTYLGTYFNGQIYSKTNKGNTLAAKSIAWILNRVKENEFDKLTANVELMHLGNCIRCGRTLTDATSIANGLGAECAKYATL